MRQFEEAGPETRERCHLRGHAFGQGCESRHTADDDCDEILDNSVICQWSAVQQLRETLNWHLHGDGESSSVPAGVLRPEAEQEAQDSCGDPCDHPPNESLLALRACLDSGNLQCSRHEDDQNRQFLFLWKTQVENDGNRKYEDVQI